MNIVLYGPINNKPELVLIMAWDPTCDKPLSEPLMYNLLTHIHYMHPWASMGRYGWLGLSFIDKDYQQNDADDQSIIMYEYPLLCKIATKLEVSMPISLS